MHLLLLLSLHAAQISDCPRPLGLFSPRQLPHAFTGEWRGGLCFLIERKPVITRIA